MYATIHRFRRWPDEESQAWAHSLLPSLPEGGQPAGWCALGRLDGMDGAVFALWLNATDAAAATHAVGGAGWLDACAYRVVQVEPGVAAGERPRFAQLIWLNGAGDADRADAALRAGRERIAPAVRDVEGVVGTYVLRAEDDRLVVLTLVTGVDTPEALRRAILATRLMPWEDPAQLTDPDRIDIDRVLVAQLPMEVRS
jgi:hypothetical protein